MLKATYLRLLLRLNKLNPAMSGKMFNLGEFIHNFILLIAKFTPKRGVLDMTPYAKQVLPDT